MKKEIVVAYSIFGGNLDLASYNPKCSRMAQITDKSLMKLMIRMVP